MEILSEPALLAALNAAPGVKVSRSTFKQSIRPLFILRGEAQQMGAGNRATWVYDATRVGEWQEYLAVRAELIRRGTWHSKRPYDWGEMEGIVQGNAHQDVLDELFPPQAGAVEGARNDRPRPRRNADRLQPRRAATARQSRRAG